MLESLASYLFIFLVSLLINIPFGYIRQNCPKFSIRWLFWIHASIPVLIYLRIMLQISPISIPMTIALAIAGQILGSRLRQKQMSKFDFDRLHQIPENFITKTVAVKASDLTILLLNMGGPRTNTDVKAFQKLLFNDSLLIRFPLSFLFQRFFSWLLVTLRSHETEKRYQLIGGGSPIYSSTEAQVSALAKELARRGLNIAVDYSFNYSPPLPEESMHRLKNTGKKNVLLLSLYPHDSAATTGSNIHYLKKAAEKIYPELQLIPAKAYYLHDGYLQAFVDRIDEQIKPHENLDDFYIVFSAHGLPLYFLTEGDLYPFQISQTVAGILGKLKRSERWIISYQSAVGPLQWLKPSTDDILRALARENIKKVLIVPVSFVGDHIETTCEIDIEYRDMAQKCGITDFRMSKAIESHPEFIRALADTVESSVQITDRPKPAGGSTQPKIFSLK
jgi:ferrochelatase